MKCVPPDSAASWFCPVPAAGGRDTRAAAPRVRAKGGGASTLLIAGRSASAPAGVQESLKMCSFTVSTQLQEHLPEYKRDCVSRFRRAF